MQPWTASAVREGSACQRLCLWTLPGSSPGLARTLASPGPRFCQHPFPRGTKLRFSACGKCRPCRMAGKRFFWCPDSIRTPRAVADPQSHACRAGDTAASNRKVLPAFLKAEKIKRSRNMPYSMESYDIAVIGAGHAGIEAAVAAAKLGAKVALFTHDAGRGGEPTLQPLDRRHRQGPSGAGDRRAGRRDGEGGGRRLPAEPDAQPRQRPRGAQPARPVGPARPTTTR